MDIRLLGPCEMVTTDGVAVTPPQSRTLAVLTVIAHRIDAVSVTELLDRAWDVAPTTGAEAVRRHIAVLRRRLGDDVIVTTSRCGAGGRGGYTLSPHVTVDIRRFRRLRRVAKQAAATGQYLTAVAVYDEALSLFRGLPTYLPAARGLHAITTAWDIDRGETITEYAHACVAAGVPDRARSQLGAHLARHPHDAAARHLYETARTAAA